MCQICSFLHLRFVHLCTVVRVAFGGHFDMKRPRLPDAAGQAVRLVLSSKLQFECLEHLGTHGPGSAVPHLWKGPQQAREVWDIAASRTGENL